MPSDTRPASPAARAPQRLRFELLGPVRLWRDGDELDPGFPQQRALLALLLMHAGRPVPTAEILDVLWAQRPPASAPNVVRRYVAALRRLLEPGSPPRTPGPRLPRRTGGHLLEADPDEVDLLRFRERTREGKRAAATGRPGTAARQFVLALGEWRGPVAMGVPAAVRDHAQFTAVQRELLETARLAADAALLCGRAEQVLPVLRRAAAHDPLDEPLHARLMLVLAASGLQAEALRAYDDVRLRLTRELGLAPGPELAAAHARVLRQEVGRRSRPAPLTPLPAPTTTPPSPPAPLSSAAPPPVPAPLSGDAPPPVLAPLSGAAPSPPPAPLSEAASHPPPAPLSSAAPSLPPAPLSGAASPPPPAPLSGAAAPPVPPVLSPAGPHPVTPVRSFPVPPPVPPARPSASPPLAPPALPSAVPPPVPAACSPAVPPSVAVPRSVPPAPPATVPPPVPPAPPTVPRSVPPAPPATVPPPVPPASPVTGPSPDASGCVPSGSARTEEAGPGRLPSVAGGPGRRRCAPRATGGAEVAPRGADAAPAVRSARLPPAPACFVGREAESRLLEGAAGAAAGVVVVAGTAGVGKSALALHWAHGTAGRFPDGRLYVALHGSDPARPPVRPAEALRAMLAALGEPASRLPDGLDALTGRYRTLLAHRRVLVVLDDAAGTAQLRPLLPAGPGCLALVTGRQALPGLVASGARQLRLGPPSAEDALALLAARVGAGRVAAEPGAADEIVARCGRSPLALTTVAARLAGRPDVPLASEAAVLRDTHGTLDALDAVREALLGSYRHLPPDQARLFRLLPRLGEDGITASGAAGLTGLPARRARLLLGALADAHLLTEAEPGRYTLHVLLSVFAAERAAAEGGLPGP
ncbi:AfsR/SARP family transcriptional regulator [Streptomyces asoensis]|uniref:AfsR/SARP family transcriptional regulator n=1 Tax=Streptomyces asoensis TaxID=249586 RepID=UPI0033BFD318